MNYINKHKNILYVDWNIFILLKENKKLFDVLQLDQYELVVYSPAHIEDLANSLTKKNIDEEVIEKDLNFLSKTTNNIEIYPNHGDLKCNKAVCIVEENPKECYKRVIRYYNKTMLAESLNRELLEHSKNNKYFDNDINQINNISFDKIFGIIFNNIISKYQFIHEYNINIINHKLQFPYLSDRIILLENENFQIDNFNKNFFNILIIIEMLANLLDNMGYWKDKIKNAHNRMNDVTHIIYGTFSDKFITIDKRMFRRAKAIYDFLRVDNEVLYFDQKNNSLRENI